MQELSIAFVFIFEDFIDFKHAFIDFFGPFDCRQIMNTTLTDKLMYSDIVQYNIMTIRGPKIVNKVRTTDVNVQDSLFHRSFISVDLIELL